MIKFRINNFTDVCCLTSLSIVVVTLASFTPQPTFASQNWGAAEVEKFVGSISPIEDEWVDFSLARPSDTNSPNARDTYAIKRSHLGTGMRVLCLQPKGQTNTRNGLRSNCGAGTVWVKGDHSKNRTVSYRTSLTRYGVNCGGWTYSKDQFLAYNAKGDVINQWEKAGQLRAIVPGSFEENLARAYCKQPQ